MSDKILVPGSSGHLGRATLQHLLERRPASQLVGLVRDPSKASYLAAKGIELRQGDYLDYDGLFREPSRTSRSRKQRSPKQSQESK